MTVIQSFVQNLPRPPTKAEREAELAGSTRNPLKLFARVSPLGHALFWTSWLAWTADAYDFFTVSLSVSRLSEAFFGSVSTGNTHKITTSITLTLLFRSIGALSLGILSDRYGRKWPLIGNLICIVVLQIGTAFCNTFDSFLAVRSLFGIFMGGIWGVCTAGAMEALPAECRGLFSGILQQGYAVGYLLAAIINLYAVPAYGSYKILFYVGAGLTALAAICRLVLPESDVFLRAQEQRRTEEAGGSAGKAFGKSVKAALKQHWARCIYAIVLMSFFNFFSHGSQDLYPTYMQQAKGFSAFKSTQATIVGNCGAIFGGLMTGYISQYVGRRLTIILCCIWTAVFIPLWILPSTFGGLAAGAFFVQVGVQGAWGVIPIYLSEISPPAFRAVFAGLAYQLGNAASSASAQIEATAGEHLRTFVRGQDRPDYGTIQAIIIGIVCFAIICCMLVGKEHRGAQFESAKAATQAGGGAENPQNLAPDMREKVHDEENGLKGGEEKQNEYRRENL